MAVAQASGSAPPEGLIWNKERPIRILSLDGGGYRGLASLRVLKHILKNARPKGIPPAVTKIYPHEYFDLICGTSTGGLIAILLGRMKMDIDTAIETYESLGPKIFGNNKGIRGVVYEGARFDERNLEDAFRIIVKEDLMLNPSESNDGCRCFVTVQNCRMAAAARAVYLIRSYASERHDSVPPDGHSWTILEAARGTSAAPTYFNPLSIVHNEVRSDFQDAGASGANNPSSLAWDEIGKIPEFDHREIDCFLSLGTGLGGFETSFKAPKKRNPSSNRMICGFRKLKDILLAPSEAKRRFSDLIRTLADVATSSEDVHVVMYGRLPKERDVYFRFNPPNGLAAIALEDYSKSSVIEGTVAAYVQDPHNKALLGRCADKLRLELPPTALSVGSDTIVSTPLNLLIPHGTGWHEWISNHPQADHIIHSNFGTLLQNIYIPSGEASYHDIKYNIDHGLVIWEDDDILLERDAAWVSFWGLKDRVEGDFRLRVVMSHVLGRNNFTVGGLVLRLADKSCVGLTFSNGPVACKAMVMKIPTDRIAKECDVLHTTDRSVPFRPEPPCHDNELQRDVPKIGCTLEIIKRNGLVTWRVSNDKKVIDLRCNASFGAVEDVGLCFFGRGCCSIRGFELSRQTS